MSAVDCFSNIIGLSRSTCECFEEGRPEDYNLSDSDLFLDELEYLNLNLAEAAADCSSGSLWDVLLSARKEAVNHFQSDLMGCIRSKTKLQRKSYKGLIGNPYKKVNSDLAMNNTFHGVRWFAANVVGGFIRIKRIGTMFNQTSTITLKLYNSEDEDVQEFILDTEAYKLKWNDITPVELDLKATGFNKEFAWLYTPAGGLKARNLVIDCNCGSGFHPSWNSEKPQFYSKVNKGDFGWADWILAEGTKGNNIDNWNQFTLTNETQGLVFDLEIGCRMNTVLCDEEFDFVENQFAKVMAHAVRFRAAAIVLAKGISSGNPSRYTLLDGDNVAYAKSQCMKEYDRRITWLCDEMSKPENINQTSDCLVCNDEYGLMKSGVFK